MTKINGRGATNNLTSTRFNSTQREADGDWLNAMEQMDGPAPKLRTTVTVLKSKTIITRNNSPDVGFDQWVNAYRGCEQNLNSTVTQDQPFLG